MGDCEVWGGIWGGGTGGLCCMWKAAGTKAAQQGRWRPHTCELVPWLLLIDDQSQRGFITEVVMTSEQWRAAAVTQCWWTNNEGIPSESTTSKKTYVQTCPVPVVSPPRLSQKVLRQSDHQAWTKTSSDWSHQCWPVTFGLSRGFIEPWKKKNHFIFHLDWRSSTGSDLEPQPRFVFLNYFPERKDHD